MSSFRQSASNKTALSDVGSYDTVSVGTTATLIEAKNLHRVSFTVVNSDAAATVYLGMDDQVTTANGLPVVAGASFTEDYYVGDIYAIVGSGTVDLRYWIVA